nr:hypothetical protein [Tanacetum cinerariifolium]
HCRRGANRPGNHCPYQRHAPADAAGPAAAAHLPLLQPGPALSFVSLPLYPHRVCAAGAGYKSPHRRHLPQSAGRARWPPHQIQAGRGCTFARSFPLPHAKPSTRPHRLIARASARFLRQRPPQHRPRGRGGLPLRCRLAGAATGPCRPAWAVFSNCGRGHCLQARRV